MITKKLYVDYLQELLNNPNECTCLGPARAVTLDSSEVSGDTYLDDSEFDFWTCKSKTKYEHTHKDGWKISGYVFENYFQWVNEFEAHHPFFGRVWGDFDDVVYADSEEGFEHFCKNHPYQVWDYQDI